MDGCSLKDVMDVVRNHPFAGTAPIECLKRHYKIDNTKTGQENYKTIKQGTISQQEKTVQERSNKL